MESQSKDSIHKLEQSRESLQAKERESRRLEAEVKSNLQRLREQEREILKLKAVEHEYNQLKVGTGIDRTAHCCQWYEGSYVLVQVLLVCWENFLFAWLILFVQSSAECFSDADLAAWSPSFSSALQDAYCSFFFF